MRVSKGYENQGTDVGEAQKRFHVSDIILVGGATSLEAVSRDFRLLPESILQGVECGLGLIVEVVD